ncbi:flavin reductase family protein [Mycobacterium sp. pW049]|uniref:flavin reductase family protein n=1 Tax=[Mycobacterium] bulgaricum TaxID=3238985 RepID=UPI00351B44E8
MTVGPRPADATVPDHLSFRTAMSRVPTSVIVIATIHDGEPIGMLVGTFTSVSLSPMLVGYLGERTSRTVPYLLDADRVSCSVLRETDLATVEEFRKPMASRFERLNWTIDDEFEVPLLAGAPLTVVGKPHSVCDAGDHIFSLIEVLAVRTNGPSRPLVFCGGRLTRMDPSHVVDSDIWQLGWT